MTHIDIASAKATIERQAARIAELEASARQSWYGDIVKVRSDKVGTTITIDLRPREDRLIPSAGERVKIC